LALFSSDGVSFIVFVKIPDCNMQLKYSDYVFYGYENHQ